MIFATSTVGVGGVGNDEQIFWCYMSDVAERGGRAVGRTELQTCGHRVS